MANGRELVPLRTGFDVVLRGYRRGPVHQYVQSVEEEIRSLAADRDANADLAENLTREVEQLRAENASLGRRLDKMCRTPIEAEALPERLRRMLELAKEEAAEITARAQAAAEHCWATAEDAAGRLRARYEQSIAEVDGRRRAMEEEHRTLLQQTRLEVAEMTTEADRRCEELDTKAARRREQIETDFDVAMSARRTEAMQKIAEQKVAAHAEVKRLLGDARAEADRLVTEATAEANRLVTEATDDANRLVSEATAKSDRLVSEATAESDRLVTEATAEANRLVTEATDDADRRVTEATAEANRLVTEATAEANRLVTEATDDADRRVTEATAEANRLVTEATADAAHRVDVATGRVDRLRDLRGQVADQVRAAREVLAGAAPLLQAVESEEDDTGPRQAAIPAPRERVAPTQATR